MMIKEKFADFAVKHDLVGKAQKLERAAIAGAAAVTAAGMSAVNAFAFDVGMTVTADKAVEEIAEGVAPYTEPAVIILCGVAGIKLGQKLLKRAAS